LFSRSVGAQRTRRWALEWSRQFLRREEPSVSGHDHPRTNRRADSRMASPEPGRTRNPRNPTSLLTTEAGSRNMLKCKKVLRRLARSRWGEPRWPRACEGRVAGSFFAPVRPLCDAIQELDLFLRPSDSVQQYPRIPGRRGRTCALGWLDARKERVCSVPFNPLAGSAAG
jgi:hypothetical protein